MEFPGNPATAATERVMRLFSAFSEHEKDHIVSLQTHVYNRLYALIHRECSALLAASSPLPAPQPEHPHCENCGAVGVELQELMCRSCWEANTDGSRFHWRDGVYFQRVDSGAVLMTLPNAWKVIPADEWASLVAHLSASVPTAPPKASE